jgi:tetratricopeptide (TPR) repeat protein
MKRLFYRRFLVILLALLVGCSGSGPGDGEQDKEAKKAFQWQRGQELFFDQGHLLEAYDYLSALYQEDPDFDEPYFHFILGEVEWEWHNYPVAIQHFLHEVENWDEGYDRPIPARADLLWYIADGHHQMGLMFKGFFNTALNVERNYYDFLLSLNSLRKDRQMPSGELTLYPYREDYIFFFRGLCHFHLGFPEEAQKDWERIEPSSELFPRGQAMLGVVAFAEGKKAKAESLWGNPAIHPGDLGIAELLTGDEELRGRGFERLSSLQGEESHYSDRFKAYFSWESGRRGERPKVAGQVLQELDFGRPEFRQQWGKLVPEKGEPIEYYADFYDPSWLNILADHHLRRAIEYYRQYEEAVGNPAIEGYVPFIELALGESERALERLQRMREDHTLAPGLRVAVLAGLQIAEGVQEQRVDVDDLDGELRKIIDRDPGLRSDFGSLLAEMGGDTELALRFCRTTEAMKPGPFSRNLAYVLFVRGVGTQDMGQLTRSIELYEKNHRAESIYSVRQNDPRILQGLANACYGRRWFDFGPKIYLKFRDMYPQVEQIFVSLRRTSQVWETLKWDRNDVTQIEWRELSHQQRGWYSETLKTLVDNALITQ